LQSSFSPEERGRYFHSHSLTWRKMGPGMGEGTKEEGAVTPVLPMNEEEEEKRRKGFTHSSYLYQQRGKNNPTELRRETKRKKPI